MRSRKSSVKRVPASKPMTQADIDRELEPGGTLEGFNVPATSSPKPAPLEDPEVIKALAVKVDQVLSGLALVPPFELEDMRLLRARLLEDVPGASVEVYQHHAADPVTIRVNGLRRNVPLCVE